MRWRLEQPRRVKVTADVSSPPLAVMRVVPRPLSHTQTHTHPRVFILVFALCCSSLVSSPCNYTERTDGGQRRVLTVNFPCFYFDRTAENVAERGWWHSAKGMTLSQGVGEAQFLPSEIPGHDWWRTRFHVCVLIQNNKKAKYIWKHCRYFLWGADTLLPQFSHLVDCTF